LDLNDLRLGTTLEKIEADTVIHLAAQTDVRLSMEDPCTDLMNNGFATLNLIQQATKYGCKNFVNINSGGAVYAPNSKVPYTEDSFIKPQSAYGITKQLAEDYVRLFCQKSDVSWKSLALSNVYGSIAQNKKGIFYQAWSAIEENRKFTIFGKEVTRDYVHVLDVISAIKSAISSTETGKFNIGTGIETSNLEVFNLMKEKLNSNLDYEIQEPRLGEVLRSSLDVSKAKSKLHWEPRIKLKQGVDKILEGLVP
jgi:UDP-glucose 4-epimerase